VSPGCRGGGRVALAKKKNRKCPATLDSQETRVEAFAWQGISISTAVASWLRFQASNMKNLADKLCAIKPSRGVESLEKGFVMSASFGMRNEGD